MSHRLQCAGDEIMSVSAAGIVVAPRWLFLDRDGVLSRCAVRDSLPRDGGFRLLPACRRCAQKDAAPSRRQPVDVATASSPRRVARCAMTARPPALDAIELYPRAGGGLQLPQASPGCCARRAASRSPSSVMSETAAAM
jgi:hypothetical protein